jgi:transcriptional regulator with XRE-family HTH domain
MSEERQMRGLVRLSREERQSLTAPGLRTFFRIANKWKLDDQQQRAVLGGISHDTLNDWRRGETGVIADETLERISYVLGIFKALNILLPIPERADAWIRKTNMASAFGGRTALDLLAGGRLADLRRVRLYLDAQLV